MPDFLQNISPETVLSLVLMVLLMGLLVVRAKVSPRASLFVKASPEKVFDLIFPHDGKEQQWRHTLVRYDLVDHPQQIFRVTYSHKFANGSQQSSTALFRVHSCHPAQQLALRREGLDGKPTRNELLEIITTTSPEKGGTRLTQTYYWGERPLLAQIMARTDLWSGIYRLKALAETGKPTEHAHDLIYTILLIGSALISVAAFGLVIGWALACVLVLALFVHELGHLIAYRLIGQPWGRMVFLPFLGAIAMPRLHFQNQAQAIFSALMGPGFSLAVLSFMMLFVYLEMAEPLWTAAVGIIVCVLNLFNLLPAEPLDGGVASRFLMRGLLGNRAHLGMILLSTVLVCVGFFLGQLLLIVFGVLSVLLNLRAKAGDAHLKPLTIMQWLASFAAYIGIIIAYCILLIGVLHFLPQ